MHIEFEIDIFYRFFIISYQVISYQVIKGYQNLSTDPLIPVLGSAFHSTRKEIMIF